MKVKVIKRYNDLSLKAIQEPGTILDVTERRGEYLIGQGMAEAAKDTRATKDTGKD